MNHHASRADFASGPLKLVAVPAPGDTTTYQRLADLEHEAYALWRSIIAYTAIPAFPQNADYRERRMTFIEKNIADMRKALGDA